MKPAFELLGQQVTEFLFSTDADVNTTEIQIEFNPEISTSADDENIKKYVLQINIKGSIILNLKIEGIFKSNQTMKDKEDEDMLFFKIGFAILFPYARAFISTTTALATGAALNLPLVNVEDLFN